MRNLGILQSVLCTRSLIFVLLKALMFLFAGVYACAFKIPQKDQKGEETQKTIAVAITE